MIKSRIFRFIVGLDQSFNPLVFNGSEDVTISSQTAYNELILGKNRRMRATIDFVFKHVFGQHHHCYRSLLWEIDEFPNQDIILAALLAKGVS